MCLEPAESLPITEIPIKPCYKDVSETQVVHNPMLVLSGHSTDSQVSEQQADITLLIAVLSET